MQYFDFTQMARRAGKALGNVSGVVDKMVHPSSGFFAWDLRGTKFDYARKVGDGHDSSVVMGPLTWISTNATQAPFIGQVLKGEKWERNVNSELEALLENPNPEYDGDKLTQGTIICLLTAGDAYWITIRDQQGKPAELWLAPSHLVEPKNFPGNEGASFIDFYSYQPGSGEIRLDPEDVVHLRDGLNPRNTRKGLSRLYPVLREVFSDTEAANFTGALLHNMGVPGVIISPKDKESSITDEKVAQKIKDKFISTFTNDKRGAAMVNTVPVDVQQFGFDPDKLAIDKVRNISEERMCVMLHIAAAVVGFGTGLENTKVGATMAEMRRSSWLEGIVPVILNISKTATKKLEPQFGNDPKTSRVRPDLSEVQALQENEDSRVKRVIMKVKGGIQTVFDGQVEVGDEGDPTQKVYLRGSNVIETSAGGSNSKSLVAALGTSVKTYGVEALTADLQTAQYRTIKFQMENFATKARPNAAQAQLMAALTRGEAKLAREWEPQVLAFLEDSAGIIAAAALSVLENKQLAETQLILDSVNLQAMENELRKLYEDQYARSADVTLNALNNTMGVTIAAPDLVAQQAVAMGGRQAGLLDFSATTRTKLFEILTEAEIAGLGVPETTRMIRGTVTAGRFSSPQIRARLIARTETLHAQRTSTLSAYRQIPDVNSVLVFDARLGETDEECANLDGAEVTIAEAETLSAEEHPNGTRAFAPIVR